MIDWPSFGIGALTGAMATVALIVALIAAAMHVSGEMDSGGREP